MKFTLLDSTLRDGAQAEGIYFSVEDKLNIVRALDDMGITYIEAGNPGSNPKDMEFFQHAKGLKLNNSRLVAFGSTRKKDCNIEEDANLKAILDTGVDCVAVVGKAWSFQVTRVLETTTEENLKMISQTVSYLKAKGKEVIFDAEHFFDGFKENERYAFSALQAAADAGADSLVLCDTNGGTLPMDIYNVTSKVCQQFPDIKVGIHCHNDAGMAVANSMLAAAAGAAHIQGTFLGFGERCGNAALATVIPNLKLKMGAEIEDGTVAQITSTARYIAEIANISIHGSEPYVGNSAFAHKAGMHADGVLKDPSSFEHIDPERVGNERKILTSEFAGRTAILKKINSVFPSVSKDSPETIAILNDLKELERQGYQFEGAESSFELIIRKRMGKYRPFFELVSYKIIGESPCIDGNSSTATIKIRVDGRQQISAAEGEGPVHALDKALREALEVFYPNLSQVHLIDYKVRVLEPEAATGAKVRVLIQSSDGKRMWSTVGVSTDIIQASWIALVDSIEYKLIRDIEHNKKA